MSRSFRPSFPLPPLQENLCRIPKFSPSFRGSPAPPASTITSSQAALPATTISTTTTCSKAPRSYQSLPDQCPEPSPSQPVVKGKGKRGRPRKHAPKLPLPPLYVLLGTFFTKARLLDVCIISNYIVCGSIALPCTLYCAMFIYSFS